MRRGFGLILAGTVMLGAGGSTLAFDWLKPCTDWTSRVPPGVRDPAKGYVFVSMGGCETVLAIDTRTHRVVAAQKAGDGAHGIAVPRPGTAFVANRKDDTLSLLDFAAPGPVRTVTTGEYPLDVVTGGGGAVFVATWKGDTVEIYNAAGDRARTIKGGDPTHFAVSPDGATIFLAHWDENRVTAHEATTWRQLFAAPTGKKPVHLTVTPDGRFLYVTNFGSGDVTVIDIPAGKAVATIPVGGKKPLGLIASGDGSRVLVAVMSAEMLVAIDVASQTVSRKIKADGEPQHLALARDGRTVYVTMPHQGRVDVLDAVDLEWRARIETGPSPQQIAPRYGDR